MLRPFAQFFFALSISAFCVLAGCEGRPTLFPPSDPSLKKTSAEFAADAAKRTYPAAAPRGESANAQAQVDHGVGNCIKVINLSDDKWSNIELWVNESYVVFLAEWNSKEMKTIDFPMLYNRDGHSFPLNNKDTVVDKIEILKDGKLQSVSKKLAD